MTYEKFENEVIDIAEAIRLWTSSVDKVGFPEFAADLRKIKDRINALWTEGNLHFHVRMLKDVTSELPSYLHEGKDLTAKAGEFYFGTSNKLGAITIRTRDGSMLGVKPGEFEIVEPVKIIPSDVPKIDPGTNICELQQTASEAAVMAYQEMLRTVFSNLWVGMADEEPASVFEAYKRAETGLDDARKFLINARKLIAGMRKDLDA